MRGCGFGASTPSNGERSVLVDCGLLRATRSANYRDPMALTSDLAIAGAAVPKVFGIGWAKTGTTSLGRAFEVLGLSQRGADLDLVLALAEGRTHTLWQQADRVDAFQDIPWSLVYAQAYERYPGARFILTTRRPESWIRSYRKMLERQPSRGRLVDVRQFVYGFDPEKASDARLLDRVARHEAEAMAFFADKQDRFTRLSWEAGDGWPELCRFLDMTEPTVAFPHENRAPSRLQRLAKRLRQKGRAALALARSTGR